MRIIPKNVLIQALVLICLLKFLQLLALLFYLFTTSTSAVFMNKGIRKQRRFIKINNCIFAFYHVGSTAIVVLIKEGKMFIGNVGDSRAVACWNGRTDPLSHDHKPANELESKRIQAAGGWVELNRVNGNLALSRALGDFLFKRNAKKPVEEQIVTALPDVEVRDITQDLEFIVLACDGIWDVMTNEEVVSFIRHRIAARMPPATVSIVFVNLTLNKKKLQFISIVWLSMALESPLYLDIPLLA